VILLPTGKKRVLSYRNTPVIEIQHPLMNTAGVRLLMKREDLNHAEVSGNKWWKLKYNLEEAVRQGHDTVLTFGGAYSNHVYATAAAANELNLKSIGIIRGELTLPVNPTLDFARTKGMQIRYATREAYRLKDTPEFTAALRAELGNFYLIPEGGTNALAIKGCEEFAAVIDEIHADYICLPVGTGGTMAGLVKRISGDKTVLGFAVLSQASFLEETVSDFAGRFARAKWQLLTEYAYGGYARRHPDVQRFITEFRQRTGIPLDFVYTGKMMCGLFDMLHKGAFERGKTLLVIHTGGLQGHSDSPAK
jgi:1-aminocyclopropane-1-carboxylate deaminase